MPSAKPMITASSSNPTAITPIIVRRLAGSCTPVGDGLNGRGGGAPDAPVSCAGVTANGCVAVVGPCRVERRSSVARALAADRGRRSGSGSRSRSVSSQRLAAAPSRETSASTTPSA